MPVESNLILRTSVPKPSGPGFTNVIERLRVIKQLLTDIEKKSVIQISIKVKDQIPKDYKQLITPKAATPTPATAKAVTPATVVVGGGTKPPSRPPTGSGGIGGGGGGGGGSGGIYYGSHPGGSGEQFPAPRPRGSSGYARPQDIPRPSGPINQTEISIKSRAVLNEETGEIEEQVTEIQKYEKVQGSILQKSKRRLDASGRQVEQEERSVDLVRKNAVQEEVLLRKHEQRLAKKREEYRIDTEQLKKEGYTLTRRKFEQKEGISGVRSTRGYYEKATYEKPIDEGIDPRTGRQRPSRRFHRVSLDETGRVERKEEILNLKVSKEANAEFEKRLAIKKKLFEETKKITRAEVDARRASGYENKSAEIHSRRYLPSGVEKATYKKGVLVRQNAADETKEDVFVYNEFTGTTREYIGVSKQATAQIIRQTKAQAANAAITELQAKGYTVHGQRVSRSVDGTIQKFTELRKVRGNAFTGYEIELAKVNTRTGEMTSEVIKGTQAQKMMGDSLARSVAKVALWGAAVGIVAGTAAAFRLAAVKVMELEQNTILLARVGKGLGDTFGEQLQQAHVLTGELVELSAAMSSDAAESQRAAAVFARAGLNRMEILEATKAALLASRIAELDTVESAQLLSAALSQFHLQAADLIPTLDTLNELSNNYRVTTDDLLQSISRTGSVIDQHGGRLSELAAITAVVAQTTARTGAEIGNAIKTISSRLSSEDVAGDLFKRTGITAIDAAGNARGLSEVLLELQVAFSNLSVAEQDSLTISIAGVRQRNLLIAAIEQASAAAVAESKALGESGSAMAEQQATTGTTEAALKNLRGTLIEIANDIGKDAVPVLKSLIFMLQLLADGLKFADSAPARIALFAGSFVALKTVVNLLGPSFASLSQKISANIKIAQLSNQMYTQQAGALRGAANAALSHTAAVGGGVATMLKANAAMIALLAATYLISKGIAKSAEMYAIAKQNLLDHSDASARASANAKKHTLAIEVLNKALASQVVVLRNLRGKDADDSRGNALESIKQIAEQAKNLDIVLPIGFRADDPAKVRELQDKIVEETRKGIQKEVAAIEQEYADLGTIRAKELIDAQSKLDQYRSFIKRGGTFGEQGAAAFGQLKEGFFFGADIPEAIRQQEITVSLAGDAIVEKQREVIDRLEAARERLKELGIPNSVVSELLTASQAFEATSKEIEKFKSSSAIRGNIFASSMTGQLQQVDLEFIEISKHAEELSGIYNEMNAINPNVQGLKDYKDAAEAAGDEVAEVYSNMLRLQEESLTSRIRESFSIESKINTAASRSALLRARRTMEGDTDLSANDSLATALNERNELIRGIQGFARVAQESKDPRITLAAKEEVQERLNSLVEQEVGLVDILFEREDAILQKRKESANEVQRALGLMTEEGKARLLLQADYFRRNPNKKIGIEQQLAGDAETNRITQEFFSDRVESFDDAIRRGSLLAKGPLGRIKGPGQVQAEKEAIDFNRLSGGLTAMEFAREARGRAEEAANQRNRLIGGAEIDPRLAANRQIDQLGAFDIHLDVGAFDLQPLLDKFSDIAVTKMEILRNEFMNELDQLRLQLNKTPRRPGRAAVR